MFDVLEVEVLLEVPEELEVKAGVPGATTTIDRESVELLEVVVLPEVVRVLGPRAEVSKTPEMFPSLIAASVKPAKISP